MSRLQELFQRKSNRVLNVYVTAGFPGLQDTLPVMEAIEGAGADIIELGIPYSDPLADGPVIQASGMQAIKQGMSIPVLLGQLSEMRKRISIPVILMGYMNPVLQYGFERFCREFAAAGVDALILPDLPAFEFESQYRPILRQYGLDFIFLVTPETSEERVRALDRLSSGFLYAVSSSSTTGKEQDMGATGAYLDRLRSYGLRNPVLVGFGIRDKASFTQACAHADGAIIGTAFIRAIDGAADPVAAARTFIQQIID